MVKVVFGYKRWNHYNTKTEVLHLKHSLIEGLNIDAEAKLEKTLTHEINHILAHKSHLKAFHALWALLLEGARWD